MVHDIFNGFVPELVGCSVRQALAKSAAALGAKVLWMQIGIRNGMTPYWNFSEESGMRVIHAHEFFDIGVEGTLAEIKLPHGVLVAALQRGEKLLVPRGADRVEHGDRVLLITTSENAAKLADFLAE